MTDQQNNSGWLESLIDGGLPQLFAGPAGKAISRLIGATVEIPAAKLEQYAQGIRDETLARSKIMETLAEKSAELGISDPKLLERGLNSMLGKVYREQQNREEVAKKTIEYLKEEPAPEASTGPSDDWMDAFEDYASKASSESIRDMFSRILAREIRKPGDISRAALHFVSILDAEVARIIEKVAPYSIENNFFPKDIGGEEIQYGEWLILEEAGFLSLGAGNLSLNHELNEQGFIRLRMGMNLILCKPKEPKSIRLPAVKLTIAGQQLLRTINPIFKVEEVANWLWTLDPEEVLIAKLFIRADGKTYFEDPTPFPNPKKSG